MGRYRASATQIFQDGVALSRPLRHYTRHSNARSCPGGRRHTRTVETQENGDKNTTGAQTFLSPITVAGLRRDCRAPCGCEPRGVGMASRVTCLTLKNSEGGGCPVVGEVDPPSASPTLGHPRPCAFQAVNQQHGLSVTQFLRRCINRDETVPGGQRAPAPSRALDRQRETLPSTGRCLWHRCRRADGAP